MSKRSVSVCDKCGIEFADYSVSIRSAAANISLKLVPESTEARPVGPVDLCKECLKEIFKGVKWPKQEEVATGTT
jgi:hypothetical protein